MNPSPIQDEFSTWGPEVCLPNGGHARLSEKSASHQGLCASHLAVILDGG